MAASILSGQPSAEDDDTVTTASSGMRAAAAAKETLFVKPALVIHCPCQSAASQSMLRAAARTNLFRSGHPEIQGPGLSASYWRRPASSYFGTIQMSIEILTQTLANRSQQRTR
jgi:hypothetical protein